MPVTALDHRRLNALMEAYVAIQRVCCEIRRDDRGAEEVERDSERARQRLGNIPKDDHVEAGARPGT